MELSWMGRYRELVRALVYYSNSSNRGTASGRSGQDDPALNQNEYQVLEYICEFEEENRILTEISRDTGILQSNVTKATKTLVAQGLAERYRLSGNHKSIVLRPTDRGREVYRFYAERVKLVFQSFFDELEPVSDAELARFESAVRTLGGGWGRSADRMKVQLEKIEE